MNAVIFYSNTGQSKKVAEYFSMKLGYPLVSIENNDVYDFENVILVFPIICQNLPDVIKIFLNKISVKYLTVIATYGKMCCGNVLYEIQDKYKQNIIAAAYVPTKHSYIDNDEIFCDYDKLIPILEKVNKPASIKLPKLYKNPLANLFPKQRSRLGIKIIKNKNCNECGICNKHCLFNAIELGIPNNRCIRCLKCVYICPNKALDIKVRLPLKLYLRKKKVNKTIIYI